MSCLSYWKFEDTEEAIIDEEEKVLEDIFNRTFDDLIEACKEGKVSDDNRVIGAILSLMERVVPKLFEPYKTNPEGYESMCLGTATALRVTIGSFMPFSKFMEIMNKPEMAQIDEIVEKIEDEGKSDTLVNGLANIFKTMKKPSPTVDIYG